MRGLAKITRTYTRLVTSIRRRVYAVQQWFHYQHISALLLLWVGFSLHARSLTELNAAFSTLGLPLQSRDVSLLFIFCAGALIGRRKSTRVYRFATLPLAALGLVLAWYGLAYLNTITIASLYGLGLWGLMQLFGTRPEDDASQQTERLGDDS